MPEVSLYKTAADYPDANGFLKIMYPLKDAILLVNPFVVLIFGILFVLSMGSYFTFNNMTGKTRFLAAFAAGSFIAFIVSTLFALANLITPYDVIYFIAFLGVATALLIYYK